MSILNTGQSLGKLENKCVTYYYPLCVSSSQSCSDEESKIFNLVKWSCKSWSKTIQIYCFLCPFQLYCAVGLGRSVSKVWNVQTLIYYAEQKAAGRTLPKKFENVEDDPHQVEFISFLVNILYYGINRIKY